MIDPNKKTIIFDFGNVLINLDFDTCFQNFEKYLKVDWSDRKTPESVVNAIKRYDRGQGGDEGLIWAFQQFNDKADPRDIIKSWNSLIGEMPKQRFEMLETLRKDYNIALLSNINNLHINHIFKYLEDEHGITNFEDYFDHVFYSHIIGMRKPDKEIYDHVVSELKVKPETILFLDDMQINIDAAKSYGWNGIVHNPKLEIIDQIERYLNEVAF